MLPWPGKRVAVTATGMAAAAMIHSNLPRWRGHALMIQAVTTSARNAPASGLARDAAMAREAAKTHRRRVAAQNAARAAASPSRNGSCPVATCTSVPRTKAQDPKEADRPK